MYVSNNKQYESAYALRIATQQNATKHTATAKLSARTSSPLDSINFVALTTEDIKKGYIKAAVPTAAVAAELVKAGRANVFSPQWQEQIDKAITRNGGLGNETDGYLAFANNGFVRFKNNNLTDEQNRRLAEISLTLGVAIENLPARAEKSAAEDPDIDRWVNEFIDKFDTKWAQFINDPSQSFSLSDGRRHYEVALNPNDGQVYSTYYKTHGGLKGLVQKYLPSLASALDLGSIVGQFFPGWGTAISTALQAIKGITSGKFELKNLLKAGKNLLNTFFPNFLPSATAWAKSTLSSLGQSIKSGISSLASSVASALGFSVP